MNNYLVTYLPTDPPTHHTYLPPYFLTYFPRRRRSLNKTLTRRHAAHSRLDAVDLDDPRLDWRWPCDL